MRLSVKACDLGGMLSRADKARDAALGVVAENVLADCTEYVPYDLGALRASGKASVRGGEGVVMWGTDSETARYARVQYYGDFDHGTAQNALNAPRACRHWFDAAKAVRKDAWRKMFAGEYARRVNG